MGKAHLPNAVRWHSRAATIHTSACTVCRHHVACRNAVRLNAPLRFRLPVCNYFARRGHGDERKSVCTAFTSFAHDTIDVVPHGQGKGLRTLSEQGPLSPPSFLCTSRGTTSATPHQLSRHHHRHLGSAGARALRLQLPSSCAAAGRTSSQGPC